MDADSEARARTGATAERRAVDAPAKERKVSSEYVTGIVLLLLVVILWTASNFLTNTVLTSGYDKPFAVTFANTSSFALYLIPFLCIPRKRRAQRIIGSAAAAAGAGGRAARSHAPADDEADADCDVVTTPEASAWYVKLGFILPERGHPNDTPRLSHEDPEEAAGLLANEQSDAHLAAALAPPSSTTVDLSASVDSLRPRSVRTSTILSSACDANAITARPSSIDGRRPRGNLVHVSSFRDLITSAAAGNGVDGSDRTEAPTPVVLPPLTLRETAVLAAQFTLVWFIANWSLNAGLGLTSVASGTTLSSASGFFTLGLGAIFGVERFTFSKLGAVTISFVGVVLVTRADSAALVTDTAVSASLSPRGGALDFTASAPINAPLGDFLAILSAFSYAVYVTLLKLKIGSEDRISMPLFFGFVGAINILCLWPFGVLLHLTGVERFQWPRDALTWAGVFTNMVITFISYVASSGFWNLHSNLSLLKESPPPPYSDFAYLLAMLKSSPLVATVGLSLTIPLALAGDVLRGSHSGGWLGSVGSIMVLFSFVAIGLADLEVTSTPTATDGEGRRIPNDDDEGLERGRSRVNRSSLSEQ
ncbi:hypothetical protein OC834_002176 [Tilletia horrida]|nr:hypothetical protein OC834_002176 [Tilletia horrida]